jgi:hypothetical protein
MLRPKMVPSNTPKGGEQRCRDVALVVVGHRSGAAGLHRQARLSAIEGLDLVLLIDRQNDRVLGRHTGRPHPGAFGELRVIRQLEGADTMRCEVVGFDNALQRAQTDPDRLAQARCVQIGST